MRITAILAGLLAALAITACDPAKPANMSETAYEACRVFKKDVKDVTPKDANAKIEFARKVNSNAQKAGPELKDAGTILGAAAVADNADRWVMSTDLFANKCLAAGWPSK